MNFPSAVLVEVTYLTFLISSTEASFFTYQRKDHSRLYNFVFLSQRHRVCGLFAITLGSATDGELASFLSSISFKISTFGAQRQYKKIFQKKEGLPDFLFWCR
jgi:hypothetical protein